MTRDTLATEICRDLKRQLRSRERVIAVLMVILAMNVMISVAKERR